MQELIEKEGIEYEFASGEDFATNEIMFKLIRETKVGGHVIKREYAIPAKLEWKDASEGVACGMFLTVPKYKCVENEWRKTTHVAYWLAKAMESLRQEDWRKGK